MINSEAFNEKFVYINLLDGCSLKCSDKIRCFSECKEKIVFDEQDYLRWKGVIESLSEQNVRVLYFSDEEILNYPYAVKIIEDGIKNVRMVRVSCDPVSLENFEIIRQIAQKGVDAIQIRLFGASAETHDLYRGTGSFEKTISLMELLHENSIECHVLYAINKHNSVELEKLYDLAFEKGVHHIALERSMQTPECLPIKGELASGLSRIITRSKIEGHHISLTDPVLFQFNADKVKKFNTYVNLKAKNISVPPVPKACMAGYNLLAIDCNGDTFICRFINQAIGNVFTNSMTELFSSAIEAREAYEMSRFVCKGCKLSDICGGCIAYALKYSPEDCKRDILCSRLR